MFRRLDLDTSALKLSLGGSYLADYKGVNTAGTNYYKLHVNPFNNVIVSAPSTAVINSHLHIDDTPYFWHGIGNGTGASLSSRSRPPTWAWARSAR